MAYPASSGVRASKLNEATLLIASIKFTCQQVRAEAAAGSIPSSRILDLFVNLKQARADLVATAALPGMAAVAREQFDDPGLDIVAEFNAVRDGIDGVANWITANFPKDAGGWLLAKQFSGETIVDRMFAPAQTANFRAALDSLIALIA